MTLPVSGPMQASMINVELSRQDTNLFTLDEAPVRTLAAKPSGVITLNDFYGKSNRVLKTLTITVNVANYVFSPASITGYITGKTDITITINSGIYVYSTNIANAGLTVSGWTTGDSVTIINNGYIIGIGGNGYNSTNSIAAQAGQPAINTNISLNIVNNGYIAGGGGGGGGYNAGGGGGAGGGVGGDTSAALAGGIGGTPGAVGATGRFGQAGTIGSPTFKVMGGAGGGGRILPGTGGIGGGVSAASAGTGGGAGGGAGYFAMPYAPSGAGTGGNGGSAGNVGFNGTGTKKIASGGGGGWGASGGTGYNNDAITSYIGGPGGKAIQLNGTTITTSGSGTIYGAIS